MRLLLDEHYSAEIAAGLRATGLDVRTVAECGRAGSDDETLLAHAAGERRALLTNNVRHFVPLARRWAADGRDHHGLVFSSDASMPRGRATIGRFVTALAELMRAHGADDAFVNRVHWI